MASGQGITGSTISSAIGGSRAGSRDVIVLTVGLWLLMGPVGSWLWRVAPMRTIIASYTSIGGWIGILTHDGRL